MPEAVRIAFVTTSFPMGDRSSSGIFVERLAQALGRAHQVEVITPAATTPVNATSGSYQLSPFRYGPWHWQQLAHQSGGVPVALRSRPWLRFLVPGFLAAMFWACWRAAGRCDVLHANWAPTGVVAGAAALLRRRPLVTTIRGEDAARLESSRLSRLLMALCLRLSDRVICVSEAMAAALATHFPKYAARIGFIGNGVSEEFLAVADPEEHPASVTFLIVGSLIPRKGIDTALRALSILSDTERASVKCRIVGDGPEEPALRCLASELVVADCVEFAGGLPPQRIPGELAKADALLICSHHEGRPNVVIEALAAGRAVLGTRLPGICELIRPGQEGCLFAPGDAHGLAAAMVQLLQDSQLRTRLGRNARARIRELKLTWEDAAASYRAVYARVLSAAA